MRIWVALAILAVVLAAGCTGQSGGTATSTVLADGSVELTGTMPQATQVTYTDIIGNSITAESYPGYVYVFADVGADQAAIENAIKANGGTVAESLPAAGLYTAKVKAGEEAAFLSAMQENIWFLDGSPAFSFDLSDIFMYDFHSGVKNPTNCHDDHGDLTSLEAGRLGANINKVDVKTLGGTGAIGLARSMTEQAETARKSGRHAVFSFSLQSHASATTYISPAARAAGCVNFNCTLVRSQQSMFLRTYFQTMEAVRRASPSAADNMIFVIATGNAGADLDDEVAELKAEFPEAWKRIKLVGGSFANDGIIEQYNYLNDNSNNDVAYAVGTNVQITNPATGAVTTCHGTSFSTPQVSAVLDDIWADNPTLTAEQILNAFNQALGEMGTNGVIPNDADGKISQAFRDRVLVIANGLASGKPIPGAGSKIVFVGPPQTLPAKVGEDFIYSLCQPGLFEAGATCGGLKPATNPSGGNPPYSMSIKIGGGFLPKGIALNLNGLLLGMPTTEGNYPFTVCARDWSGDEGCANVVINVAPAPPPVATTYSGSFNLRGTYGRPFPEYGTTCMFDDTFAGTITVETTGTSGTATVSGTFTSTAVGGSVPGVINCESSQSSMNDAADVTVSGNNIQFTSHFYTAGGSNYAGAFSGSLSGNTITGTFGETSSCCSGASSAPVTLSRTA